MFVPNVPVACDSGLNLTEIRNSKQFACLSSLGSAQKSLNDDKLIQEILLCSSGEFWNVANQSKINSYPLEIISILGMEFSFHPTQVKGEESCSSEESLRLENGDFISKENVEGVVVPRCCSCEWTWCLVLPSFFRKKSLILSPSVASLHLRGLRFGLTAIYCNFKPYYPLSMVLNKPKAGLFIF